MTDENRTWSRPVEEVAKWIYDARNGPGVTPWSRRDGNHKAPYIMDAQVALTRLISLGFINENGIEAMKAEKDAGKTG